MSDTVFKTTPVITRYPGNPVMSKDNLPDDDGLIFNAGITKFRGKYLMVYRHDHGSITEKRLYNKISIGLAVSDDGINWRVEKDPLIDDPSHPMLGAYDPRLTVIEDRLYMCIALGNSHGTMGGVAVSDDIYSWELLSLSAPDNRNMVLFPERHEGKLVRLERPFASYLRPGDRFDIFISCSPEGRYWGDTKCLLGTESIPWVNNKIGPANPPLRTREGWLAFFHGVDVQPDRQWGWARNWNKRYSAGLMLMDLNDPYKIIGLSDGPVLVPEPKYDYEAKGYRAYVIFPGGTVLEDDGTVKIYYGSADTVEALATARLDDLLSLCKAV